MPTPAVRRLIALALEEDRPGEDYTTLALIPADARAAAEVVARQGLCLCGLPVAAAVCAALDPALVLTPAAQEGAWLDAGSVAARLAGNTRSLLAVERTLLNFLGRMSGVATQALEWTHVLREAWERLPAGERSPRPPRLVDTRKTLPGWRELDKYAVRTGGAGNHRLDLAGGVLIKDNHLAAAGGVRAALERARGAVPHGFKLEVEVTSAAELEEALAAGAEIVLLDNMDDAALAAAIARCRAAGVPTEVSGGVTLARLPKLAALGPDLISAGALTHSAPNADLALDFV